MFWGPAIAFIILGATQYRFADRLGIKQHERVKRIGKSFWRGGWGALTWALVTLFFPCPASIQPIGIAVATIWVGFEAIGVSNWILNNEGNRGGEGNQ